jgi:hypothetical protein
MCTYADAIYKHLNNSVRGLFSQTLLQSVPITHNAPLSIILFFDLSEGAAGRLLSTFQFCMIEHTLIKKKGLTNKRCR